MNANQNPRPYNGPPVPPTGFTPSGPAPKPKRARWIVPVAIGVVALGFGVVIGQGGSAPVPAPPVAAVVTTVTAPAPAVGTVTEPAAAPVTVEKTVETVNKFCLAALDDAEALDGHIAELASIAADGVDAAGAMDAVALNKATGRIDALNVKLTDTRSSLGADSELCRAAGR